MFTTFYIDFLKLARIFYNFFKELNNLMEVLFYKYVLIDIVLKDSEISYAEVKQTFGCVFKKILN